MSELDATTPISCMQTGRHSLFKNLLLVTLLLLHFLLAVSSVRHKSNTFDEFTHLAAGYSYWTMNDYRLLPENGNLPQRWAALPLLFSKVSFPGKDSPLWENFNVWEIGYRFLYAMGNDPDTMIFRGRVMVCILSVALALVVFFWSRQLFGTFGGFISLSLYTFSPTMIAHARLTTSEMASALFFVLAVKLLWGLLHRISWPRVILAGLAVAGLLLSKMSGVLIVPMMLLFWAARQLRHEQLRLNIGREIIIHDRRKVCATIAAALFVVAVISTIVVWGFYGFRYAATQTDSQGQTLSFPTWQKEIERVGDLGQAIEFMRDRRLLPEAYLFGFTYVISHAKMRSAFYNGAYSVTGWWQFFPFCYAVKTPLSSMLMLVIALAAVFWRKDGTIGYNLIPLAVFIGVYWLVAMHSNINIGHRHILVTYPALFIISGAASLWLTRFKKAGVILFLAVFMVYIPETVAIWPDYLAYFNAASGGPRQGYRRLVDSSLDWGQDLPALSRWLQENNLNGGQAEMPVYLSYFGTASPKYYNINARMVVFQNFPWYPDIIENKATRLVPGVYCISATALQQVYEIGKWQSDKEQRYRRLREVNREYQASLATSEKWTAFKYKYGGYDQISRLIIRFRELQFGRLCHFLKQGQPDHHVGYSILIYYVTPRELWQALEKPWTDILESDGL